MYVRLASIALKDQSSQRIAPPESTILYPKSQQHQIVSIAWQVNTAVVATLRIQLHQPDHAMQDSTVQQVLKCLIKMLLLQALTPLQGLL